MDNSLMTLEEYRKSHPMDLDTVLQIGLDICRSLENGLPHGEINASGICVTEDWQFVFDNTKAAKETDTAADIYALGMLMYRLLNKGRLPFMPPYPEKVTKEDKERAISRCLSGELFPVPVEGNEQITEVLQRACHPDRQMRFQSAGEMHMALTIAAAPVVPMSATRPADSVPQASQENIRYDEDDDEYEADGNRKKKKRKKKQIGKAGSVSSSKSVGFERYQIVFVLLSALLSCAYVFMTKNLSLADSSKMIQIGVCAAQIVLLIFATRFRVFLKLLGVLAVVDGFCTVTADLFLVRVLDGMGREFPRFYTPGYLIVVLPVVIAVFYLAGQLVRGRMGYLKNRFYAVIMTLVSLLMLLLSLSGLNRMVLTLELYPYVTGIIMLAFAVLAMENKWSGIAVRIISFLNICCIIVLMMLCGFADMVQELGIPGSLVEKVVIAVMLLLSVVIFFISGKRDDEDDEDED